MPGGIEESIKSFVSGMGDPGKFSEFFKDRPIPSPEAGLGIVSAASSPFGFQNIFQTPAAPNIENVLKNYSQEGASALSGEMEKLKTQAPTAPDVNLAGVERASANALGGNVRTPDVMTEYVKKAEGDYQTNLQSWQSQYQNLQTGWGVLNSLNDPNVAKGLTMSYMQSTLNDLEKAFPGSIPPNAMAALNSLYGQSDKYSQSINNFFRNTLALRFDLSSDVNQAVMANNYSKWLTDLVKATPPNAGGP